MAPEEEELVTSGVVPPRARRSLMHIDRKFKVLGLILVLTCLTAASVHRGTPEEFPTDPEAEQDALVRAALPEYLPTVQPVSQVALPTFDSDDCIHTTENARRWFTIAQDSARLSYLLIQSATCNPGELGFFVTMILKFLLGNYTPSCQEFLDGWKAKNGFTEIPKLHEIASVSAAIGFDSIKQICDAPKVKKEFEKYYQQTHDHLTKTFPHEKPIIDFLNTPKVINFQSTDPIKISTHIQTLFFLQPSSEYMVLLPFTNIFPMVKHIEEGFQKELVVAQIYFQLEIQYYFVFKPMKAHSILRIYYKGYATDYHISTLSTFPTAKSPLISFVKYT